MGSMLSVGVPNAGHTVCRPFFKIIDVVPCDVLSDIISQE